MMKIFRVSFLELLFFGFLPQIYEFENLLGLVFFKFCPTHLILFTPV